VEQQNVLVHNASVDPTRRDIAAGKAAREAVAQVYPTGTGAVQKLYDRTKR
jgi:hypothetical protein